MKKIIIGILLFPMLVFISACDGGYSGSKIDFKSHIDSHSMTIKLDSKIANFLRRHFKSFFGKVNI